jgi:hypothetical protein
MKTELHLAAAVAGFTVCLGLAGCGDSDTSEPARESAASTEKKDELSKLITDEVDPATVLPKATWDNLDQLFSTTAENQVLQRRFLETASKSSEPVCQFVAALLHLTQGNEAEALEVFQKLPIDQVPANRLYAAYRLHQRLDNDQPNPFRSRLRKAIETGELSPLLAARFLRVRSRRH